MANAVKELERTEAIKELVETCIETNKEPEQILAAVKQGASIEVIDLVVKHFGVKHLLESFIAVNSGASDETVKWLAEKIVNAYEKDSYEMQKWFDANHDRLVSDCLRAYGRILKSISNILTEGELSPRGLMGGRDLDLLTDEVDKIVYEWCKVGDIDRAVKTSYSLRNRGLDLEEIGLLIKAVKNSLEPAVL